MDSAFCDILLVISVRNYCVKCVSLSHPEYKQSKPREICRSYLTLSPSISQIGIVTRPKTDKQLRGKLSPALRPNALFGMFQSVNEGDYCVYAGHIHYR